MVAYDRQIGNLYLFCVYVSQLLLSFFFLFYGIAVRAALLAAEAPELRLSEQARGSLWRLVVCPAIVLAAITLGIVFKALLLVVVSFPCF